MITLQIGGKSYQQSYPVNARLYPGGEVHPEIPADFFGRLTYNSRVTIDARLRDPKDIMLLLLTVSAIRHYGKDVSIELHLPYVPYGRQDRIACLGDPHSIKVMAQLINSLAFNEVSIYDPHSDVTTALIENCKIVHQEAVVFTTANKLNLDLSDTWIVAPDAGASKKAFKVATRLKARGVITAEKVRNPSDGKILETRIHGDVRGKNVLVVDDICDGGKTFTELGKVLKEQGVQSADLYVTHGIFSKGPSELLDYYQNIYTTDSYYGEFLPFHSNRVNWLDLNTFEMKK